MKPPKKLGSVRSFRWIEVAKEKEESLIGTA
jgi:hypothetical protein